MATKTSKYVVQFEADTGDATKNVDALSDSMDSAAQSTDSLQQGMGALDSFTGGFASKAKGAIGSIKGMTSGFKSLRVAIISTGIGALVIAVGSLFVFFTKTKRGAEALEKGMAWMEGLFGVLTDKIGLFGETIFNAFKNPQQAIADLWEFLKTNFINRLEGAIDAIKGFGSVLKAAVELDWDAAKKGAEDFGKALIQISTGMDVEQQAAFVEGLKEIGVEANKAADASLKLTAAQQRLDDSNRALNVSFSARRAEIKELNKLGEDTTKSDEERRAAIEKAIEIETELMAQRLANAEQQVSIFKQQNALSESTAEDLDRVAEAEIELNRIKEESNELQTTLQNKKNTLIQQSEAKNLQTKIDAETNYTRVLNEAEEIRKALLTDNREKEEQAVNEKYDALFLKANDDFELEKEVLESQQAELTAINEKYRDIEIAEEDKKEKTKAANKKRAADASLAVAKSTFSAIGDLAVAFAGKSEKAQKKAFKIKKAADIAGVAIDTVKGAMGALTGMISTIPGPVGIILGAAAALGVVATGVVNIKKIKEQKFQGGGGSVGGGAPRISLPSGGGGTPAPEPNIDQAFEPIETAPVHAFVVATEVQDSNEATQKTEDIATL